MPDYPHIDRWSRRQSGQDRTVLLYVFAPSSPKTLEEMQAAYKARQARYAQSAAEFRRVERARMLKAAQDRVEAIQKATREAAEAEERYVEALRRMAKKAVHEFRRTPRCEQIQAIVANHYGIARADLIGRSHRRPLAQPRQIAMYLAKTLTTLTAAEIARRFSRDHTTVLFAVNKIAAGPFGPDLDALRAKIDDDMIRRNMPPQEKGA